MPVLQRSKKRRQLKEDKQDPPYTSTKKPRNKTDRKNANERCPVEECYNGELPLEEQERASTDQIAPGDQSECQNSEKYYNVSLSSEQQVETKSHTLESTSSKPQTGEGKSGSNNGKESLLELGVKSLRNDNIQNVFELESSGSVSNKNNVDLGRPILSFPRETNALGLAEKPDQHVEAPENTKSTKLEERRDLGAQPEMFRKQTVCLSADAAHALVGDTSTTIVAQQKLSPSCSETETVSGDVPKPILARDVKFMNHGQNKSQSLGTENTARELNSEGGKGIAKLSPEAVDEKDEETAVTSRGSEPTKYQAQMLTTRHSEDINVTCVSQNDEENKADKKEQRNADVETCLTMSQRQTKRKFKPPECTTTQHQPPHKENNSCVKTSLKSSQKRIRKCNSSSDVLGDLTNNRASIYAEGSASNNGKEALLELDLKSLPNDNTEKVLECSGSVSGNKNADYCIPFNVETTPNALPESCCRAISGDSVTVTDTAVPRDEKTGFDEEGTETQRDEWTELTGEMCMPEGEIQPQRQSYHTRAAEVGVDHTTQGQSQTRQTRYADCPEKEVDLDPTKPPASVQTAENVDSGKEFHSEVNTLAQGGKEVSVVSLTLSSGRIHLLTSQSDDNNNEEILEPLSDSKPHSMLEENKTESDPNRTWVNSERNSGPSCRQRRESQSLKQKDVHCDSLATTNNASEEASQDSERILNKPVSIDVVTEPVSVDQPTIIGQSLKCVPVTEKLQEENTVSFSPQKRDPLKVKDRNQTVAVDNVTACSTADMRNKDWCKENRNIVSQTQSSLSVNTAAEVQEHIPTFYVKATLTKSNHSQNAVQGLDNIMCYTSTSRDTSYSQPSQWPVDSIIDNEPVSLNTKTNVQKSQCHSKMSGQDDTQTPEHEAGGSTQPFQVTSDEPKDPGSHLGDLHSKSPNEEIKPKDFNHSEGIGSEKISLEKAINPVPISISDSADTTASFCPFNAENNPQAPLSQGFTVTDDQQENQQPTRHWSDDIDHFDRKVKEQNVLSVSQQRTPLCEITRGRAHREMDKDNTVQKHTSVTSCAQTTAGTVTPTNTLISLQNRTYESREDCKRALFQSPPLGAPSLLSVKAGCSHDSPEVNTDGRQTLKVPNVVDTLDKKEGGEFLSVYSPLSLNHKKAATEGRQQITLSHHPTWSTTQNKMSDRKIQKLDLGGYGFLREQQVSGVYEVSICEKSTQDTASLLTDEHLKPTQPYELLPQTVTRDRAVTDQTDTNMDRSDLSPCLPTLDLKHTKRSNELVSQTNKEFALTNQTDTKARESYNYQTSQSESSPCLPTLDERNSSFCATGVTRGHNSYPTNTEKSNTCHQQTKLAPSLPTLTQDGTKTSFGASTFRATHSSNSDPTNTNTEKSNTYHHHTKLAPSVPTHTQDHPVDETKMALCPPRATQGDNNNSPDLTDSQLCEVSADVTFEYEFDAAQTKARAEVSKRKTEGEKLVQTILRELQSINRQVLRMKREIETAKRKMVASKWQAK